ncbi:MAG: Yip1 family protein [Phycisphaerales bacterium]
MQCTRCAYPLWNMASRTCPECGLAFRPSEFTFLANAVKFQCPHCRQQYFGTSEGGHLEPSSFRCVTCGSAVTEDEMIIVPADGVREELAKAAETPWSLREQGLARAFWRTCVAVLLRPGRLARGLGARPDAGAAWAFLWRAVLLSAVLGGAGSGLLVAVFSVIQSFAAGSSPGVPRVGAPMLSFMAVGLAAFPTVTLMGTLVWCVLTHAVLRVMGVKEGNFARTFECMSYACVPVALSSLVAPMLICGWPLLVLPGLWMGASASAMVCERHGVRGWWAMLACFGPPAVAGILTVTVVMLLILR